MVEREQPENDFYALRYVDSATLSTQSKRPYIFRIPSCFCMKGTFPLLEPNTDGGPLLPIGEPATPPEKAIRFIRFSLVLDKTDG